MFVVLIVVFVLFLFFAGELSSIYTIIQYAFLVSLYGVVLSITGLMSFKIIMVPLIILVFMILTFFLEARLAFWVVMGIPTSFLGAILFMPILNVSINMISLFAFLIAPGIVVDDALVVGENLYE